VAAVAAVGEQGRADWPAGGLGTGLGAQVAAAAGLRVGTGTGVADPAPTGRGLATALGGSAAVVGVADEAWPPAAAEAAPEHPVSASPAATPSAAPIVTRDVLSCIRTRMLLNAVGDNDQNTGKYVAASEKLSRSGSNLSPCTAV
jgi:hypothetical protein